VDGPTGRLRHIMRHEDRRGLEHFFAKHNRYSTLEARELFLARTQRNVAAATRLERGIAVRRWLKHNVLPRLPFSGLSRFIYMYFIRLGFLDGREGFVFHVLQAFWYRLLVDINISELAGEAGSDRDPVAEEGRREAQVRA